MNINEGTGGSLTFDNGTGNSEVYLSGRAGQNKTVIAPITLNSDLEVYGNMYSRISGSVGGSKGVIINGGAGLTGDNDFSGGVQVNSGELGFYGESTTALGTGKLTIGNYGETDSITVYGQGLRFGTLHYLNDVDINQNISYTTYAGRDYGTAFDGDITLNGTRTINVPLGGQDSGAAHLELNGAIGDGANAGGLIKTGAGPLTLGGANTYTGNTTVEDGTLSITSATTIYDSSFVSILLGAKMNLDFTGSDTIAGLTIDGTSLGAGTYDSTDGTYGSYFSGSGSLTVIPEPATLGIIGIPMLLRRRIFG